MKIDKIKHNHSLTKLLKVLIFAIVMLIPAFSVASRCLYVICNKNAYQSYSGTTTQIIKNETQVPTNEISTFNDFVENNYYYFNNFSCSDVTSGDSLEILLTENTVLTFDFIEDSSLDESYFEDNLFTTFQHTTVNITDTSCLIMVLTDNYDSYLSVNVEYEDLRITGDVKLLYNYIYTSSYTRGIEPSNYKLVNYEEIQSTTLDNVFEYSMEKLGQSEYLSWTQNTAIYTGINTMTTQLGITMTTYSMVLTYWFFMIVIYVIIDIILGIFTALTHMLGKKIE